MASAFSILFVTMLIFTTMLRAWLAWRHWRHIARHREAVPADFADVIALTDHRKAADYTMAKLRLGAAELAVEAGWLLALTMGGVLNFIDSWLRDLLPAASYLQGIALFGCVGLLGFLLGLPFSLYRTFRLEAAFGFNKTDGTLYAVDLLKQLALTVLIGAPLLLLVLWLMQVMGNAWWLHVWLTWLAFNLLVLLLYPTWIAPLFNRFTPLPDGEVKTRVETLLTRCGFISSGLFVMDGSKRSAHGNAYFTGFGRSKRIVFFDTLIEKLTSAEVEAVLAHELGHFKHRHIIKRLAAISLLSLALLYLLGQLIDQDWFYQGLGVRTGGTAMALVLFSLVLPVFSFPLGPLLSWYSRENEFEADGYAAQHAGSGALVSALVKLYRDNASTLTPDPLYSLFHDSHPPASLRIARLQAC